MSRRKKDGKLHIVNLNTYTSPDIKVQQNKDYVTYGNKNEYFQYLIDRYTGSPTNNAIVNGISQMIFGKGLDATDSNKKPEEYAKMVSLFHKDCVRKFVNDLKLMGQCAIQVIYSKDRKTIAQVEHLPVETLAIEKCNEEGEIEGYYYSPDWSKVQQSSVLKRIPAFGTSNEPIEILYVRPYLSGYYYFSPVDYQGGLQYSELEEEISNYHLNNISNGLAPSMLINFNNGVPNEEEREMIESRIHQKFSGSSNAGKFILSFNENSESGSTIEPVQLSDAHNQYQFLSDESMRKIMVSHRVVSPMLLGIKDQTGLGNNADELMTASTLMDNIVIRPFQNLLIDAFDKILAFNDISLNLYFKTLQPLEFVDLENAMTKEQVEEETGVKLSKEIDGRTAYETKEEAIAVAKEMGCEGYHEHELDGVVYYMPCSTHNITIEEGESLLRYLKDDIIDDEWEVVDKRDYSEDNESIEDWANKLIKPKQNLAQKLANYVSSKPSGFSYLDKSLYKVRYEYLERYSSGKSRDFCSSMMLRTAQGVVYRLEDIDKASREGVNRKFGHNGESYDLFKYKGGVNCGHYWGEVLYRLKKKTNGTDYKKSDRISSYDEVSNIPKTYKPTPTGRKLAPVAPKDMKDNGHHPNYKG